jgi:LytS/YehU family sensor histidine kinase
MNPHFFYNALNTIQSYILSNDKKQAVNYLSKFSLLTRTILEMSEKEYISVADEIKTINLYLEIEKARFNDDFEYDILCEKYSDLEHQKIPSMLLQPYIENAIKHGLLHKVGIKKLIVSFVKNKKTLKIKIDDNGIGRQKSGELNSIKNRKHNSFATEAMQNRIDLLNKNKSKKITINYIDKLNQSQQSLGTTVVIEIPIN